MNLEGKKIAVFDCEIKKRIEDCSRGWDSYDEMGISVLVMFDYRTMRYRIFDDKNHHEAALILNTYDLVVGFNTMKFDWKLVKSTWPEMFPPLLKNGDGFEIRKGRDFDILREIWLSLGLNPDKFEPRTHGGYKLDDVAWDTIQIRKTGNGAAAPLMFQAGQFSELVDYCIEDVRIEKTLFEFIAQHEFCVRNGRVIPIPFKEEFGALLV